MNIKTCNKKYFIFFIILVILGYFGKIDNLYVQANNSQLKTSNKEQSPNSKTNKKVGYPIKVNNKVLFDIYLGIGSYTPLNRMNIINSRLKQILGNRSINIDKIKIINLKNKSQILIGDRLILTLQDEDVKESKISREKNLEFIKIKFMLP